MLRIFLFIISIPAFSQKIKFVINGSFQKEKIEFLEIVKNPAISIDTIIKDQNKFKIIGKIDYPRDVQVNINNYRSGFGIFCDGKEIKVSYEVVPDISSPKKELIVVPNKIRGNMISKNTVKLVKEFLKLKYSPNFDNQDKENIAQKIEKFIKKYPNSASSLSLIGMNMHILTDEQVSKFIKKIPYDVRNTWYGSWIQSSLKLRQTNFIGKTVPNFSLLDSSEKKHDLIDTTKQFTFVQFWASDCAPCRLNNKKTIEILPNLESKDVALVSISLDKINETWIKAVKKDKVSWLQLVENNSFESEIVKYFNFNAIPFDLLIDRNRKIVSLGFDNSIKEILKSN